MTKADTDRLHARLDSVADNISDIKAISSAAMTGEIGDGKIFVYALDEVIRIRTGQRGKEAL